MSETEILNKLSTIEKAQRKSGELTQASIGFAVTTFMVNTIANPTVTMRPLVAILGFIGLTWCLWHFVKWLRLGKSYTIPHSSQT